MEVQECMAAGGSDATTMSRDLWLTAIASTDDEERGEDELVVVDLKAMLDTTPKEAELLLLRYDEWSIKRLPISYDDGKHHELASWNPRMHGVTARACSQHTSTVQSHPTTIVPLGWHGRYHWQKMQAQLGKDMHANQARRPRGA
uniref:Uncharacterized protein n=1 Tax=Oryza punctata TaxID=4537 RepID=A0A0E0MCY4_ORYPU